MLEMSRAFPLAAALVAWASIGRPCSQDSSEPRPPGADAGPSSDVPRFEVFEKAFSMEGVSRISVENVNGPIAAQAWDKPYMKVRAVKSASGGGAGGALKQTEVRGRKGGGGEG